MRGRADGGQKKHLVPPWCLMALILGFLFLYYGSFFGSRGQHTSSALEYGSRFSRSIGWSNDDSGEVGKSDESIIELDDGDGSLVPKSFPVSVCRTSCFGLRSLIITFAEYSRFCLGHDDL